MVPPNWLRLNSAAEIRRHARLHRGQCLETAPVERQIADLFIVHEPGERGVGDFHQRRLAGDVHLLADDADAEAEVYDYLGSHRELNPRAYGGAESGEFRLHLVIAQTQSRRSIPARFVRRYGADNAGIQMRDRNRHAREARSAFVRQRSQYCSSCGLAVSQNPAQQDHGEHTPTNRTSFCFLHVSSFSLSLWERAARQSQTDAPGEGRAKRQPDRAKPQETSIRISRPLTLPSPRDILDCRSFLFLCALFQVRQGGDDFGSELSSRRLY